MLVRKWPASCGALQPTTSSKLLEPHKTCLHRAWHSVCLKRGSKSVQVLFNGIEAVLVLTLIMLK